MNRSVVGTLLTPDELDVKIRKQIHNNRHLIDSQTCGSEPPNIKMCSCNSTRNSSSCQSISEDSCHRSPNHSATSLDTCGSNKHMNACHSAVESQCERVSSHNNNAPLEGCMPNKKINSCQSTSDSYCEHLPHHNNVMATSNDCSNEGNMHYQLYLKLIQDLYDSNKHQAHQPTENNHQHSCSCSHSHDSRPKSSSLHRSKSVSFSGSHEMYSPHHQPQHQNHESQENFFQDNPCYHTRNQCVNTDIKFDKHKTNKHRNLAHSKFISHRHRNCFR